MIGGLILAGVLCALLGGATAFGAWQTRRTATTFDHVVGIVVTSLLTLCAGIDFAAAVMS